MIDNVKLQKGIFETDLEFKRLVELQNETYKERGLVFSIDGFKRWYVDNPFGKVVSFNAYDGDRMVAHYACIPTKMNIDGRVVNGIKSMATVTHPDYRGKGLFKTLAQMTYDCAREMGYEFVIGVANANSFPGFMKYFPFTFVARLDVKMGMGTQIMYDNRKIFMPYWDTDTMNWRLSCCSGNYSRENNAIIGYYNTYVQTFMGSFPDELLSTTTISCKDCSFLPKLYVGIGATFNSPYIPVPKFIKRSPFNLIFLDLTEGKLPQMTKDNIFFQLFDFDVA